MTRAENQPSSATPEGGTGRLRGLVSRLDGARCPSLALDLILDEQLNRIRQELVRGERDIRTVVVTSAIDGEGKTLVAIGLARSLARSLDHAAVLVEADLRRPVLRERFGLPPNPGLVGHILDGAPIETVIQSSPIPKLAVVCAGARVEAASNLIASSYMRRFMATLRGAAPGRTVVYDSPPVLPAPEAVSLAREADAVLFVVRAETTPRALVQQALALLPPEKLAGIALNAVPLGSRERRYLGAYYSKSRGGRRDEAPPEIL